MPKAGRALRNQSTRPEDRLGYYLDAPTSDFTRGEIQRALRTGGPGGMGLDTVLGFTKNGIGFFKNPDVNTPQYVVVDLATGFAFDTFNRRKDAAQVAAGINRVRRLDKIRRNSEGAPDYTPGQQRIIRNIVRAVKGFYLRRG